MRVSNVSRETLESAAREQQTSATLRWGIASIAVCGAGFFALGYASGYRNGAADALGYVMAQRAMHMAHCEQTDSLSSTVHTETGDIEICVSGSHRMDRMQ